MRKINRTSQIDGVSNCIRQPVVDKSGVLYGSPSGGANLLAYQGSALKWKYWTGCTDLGSPTKPVIGADGNIYFINAQQRLIGLTPSVPAGQSQPTKILDVAMGGSCSDSLSAYRDGLAVGRQAKLTYYGYSGVNLGSPPGNYWQDGRYPIDYSGTLFFPNITTVSTTVKSLNISAYNPGNKKLWTKQASTPGANVLSHAVSTPLPGGGVVVAFRQQKMLSDSVPATPTEYIYALTSFSSNGLKLWTKQLPAVDSEGYRSDVPSISADVSGNVVVVRRWIKPSTSATVQLVTADVVKGTSGEVVTSPKILKGNSNSSDGAVYGYSMEQLSTTATIGPGGVYVNASRCSPTLCDSFNPKLYPFRVTELGMDYPRGAVFNRIPRPTASYVALGDSFSSGEGVTPFATGTAAPSVNECHRSNFAYARLISGTSTKIPSLGSNGFRACSGAVTENVTDSAQWNEGAQLDLWPDATTKLVTLTIGGNDIGFGPTINTCALNPSACDSAFQTANSKVANLSSSLVGTYIKVLKNLPNARVYVIGYAPLFKAGTGCTLGPNSDYPITKSRKQQAIDLLNALNKKIKDQVGTVRAMNGTYQRLKYVPADGANSPFSGHEICSGNPYFHGLNLGNPVYSFHPKAAGQRAYATLVANAINAG